MVRLIIADRHEIFREGVKSLLADLEWIDVVGEAPDERRLMELLEVTETDTVLLDPEIGDGHGLEIVGRILEQASAVRVIVLAAADHGAGMRRAIELGADGFLLKAAGSTELAVALSVVAEGRSYIQADLIGSLLERPAASPDSVLDRLSDTQRRILRLVARGFKNKQLAKELGVSTTTVKSHLRVIYSHLGASGRVEAVASALRLGLLD